MKTIILYTRRNVGLYALSFLVAKGYKVKVISDDENVLWMAKVLGCEICAIEDMGEYDWFFCVHGNKIIPKEYLKQGRMINIHPCLFKYRGHNPIKRYIENGDILGTVESQYLIEEVDGGDVISSHYFKTPPCKTYADFYNISTPYYFECFEDTLKILGI